MRVDFAKLDAVTGPEAGRDTDVVPVTRGYLRLLAADARELRRRKIVMTDAAELHHERDAAA